MGILVTGKSLKKMVKEKGLPWVRHHLQESFDAKEITPEDFSLRDMYRHMTDHGGEQLDDWERDRRRGGHITEAIQAVDTGAMANITGQIFFNAIMDSMQNDQFIGDTLVSNFQSNLQDEEKIPGISQVTDSFEGNVTEGEPYPNVGLSEQFITIPAAEKKGGIIGVTKEALIADRTGFLIERMRSLGKALGIRREKSIIDIAIGAVNPYTWKGEARLTYGDGITAGEALGFINETAEALVNETDIQIAENLYRRMRDPATNEPLGYAPTVLLVTPALQWQARGIINATQIREGAVGAAPAQQQIGATRMPGWAQNLTIASNEWLRDRLLAAIDAEVAGWTALDADVVWFLGTPSAAFVWKEIWPLTVVEEPPGSVAEFENDVVMRFKASYKGVAGVREPRLMIVSRA